jgi:hypothetical protein
LADETQKKGKYKISTEIEYSNLESGVYFIKFTVNGISVVRKIIKM